MEGEYRVQAVTHIDAPELLTRAQRARDTFFTGLMWALYAYLWMPFISLLAWLAGVELAYDAMVRSGGAEALREALVPHSVGIALVIASVIAWSVSNRMRFRGRSRRRAPPPVDDREVAAYFGVTLAELARLREARTLALDVDADGLRWGPEPRERAVTVLSKVG